MTKKTQDLFIAIGLLLVGYFFGDAVSKINQYSPVKIPETVEEVRNVGNLEKVKNKNYTKGENDNFENDKFKHKKTGLTSEELEKLKTKNINLKEGVVKYVIDGDTIILTNGEKVRYTGVDTPERGQCWYRQAKEMNRKLVGGKKIRLEIDKSNRDPYQRLLRYIYVEDDKGKANNTEQPELFVNLELVKAGLARAKEYKPDTKYSEKLKEIEISAKHNKLGLWGGCEE